MSEATDCQHMARAIALARGGWYTTMPNPRVGCVIVDANGEIVGEGFHKRTGEPHAEVHAQQDAGSCARGATAYVTLEPCSHFGRTPPCAQALLEAGVTRVVVAVRDENPQVAGQGLELMQAAGVEVKSGVLAAEARALNEGFLKRMSFGLPLVRAKLAMSLDGRTAMASGESQWITGPEARCEVQKLRAQSCAIMTGVGSILQDDSSLILRVKELGLADAERICQRQPLRVVLDSSLRTPVDAKVIAGPGRCLIISTTRACPRKKQQLEQAGAEVMAFDEINLRQVLTELGKRQCNEVLLETGAKLAGNMLGAGLIDELIVFMAPVLMGSDALPLLDLPFRSMAEKKALTINDIRAVGNDWKITARPTVDHLEQIWRK